MSKRRMREALAAREKSGRPSEALYVHLRLDTDGGAAILAYEDIAQAAYTALAARARMLRCHVLAIGGGPSHVEAVLCFPASLSLRDLAQIAREASAGAIARALTLELGRRVSPDDIWERQSEIHTLGKAELIVAIHSVKGADHSCETRLTPGVHVV